MTDPLGQSQVLPYLTALAKRGYAITLISFEKEARFKKEQPLNREICDKVGIDWQPLDYTAKPPILSTLKDLYFLWRRVKSLQRVQTFQIVHCRSYLTGMIGLKLKNKYGTRFLFDMRGFWADERIEGGIWNPTNPIYALVYRFFKSKEIQLLKGADHTITLTETAKTIIQDWPQLRSRLIPITVIPCCVDLTHFDPGSVSANQQKVLRDSLGISNTTTIISYAGSLGTWYMLPEMLSFFSMWLKRHPDSVFMCLTGDDQQQFWKEVQAQGLPLQKFRIKSVARNEMPLHLSISQYSLFFIRPVFSKKASSPTKQGEIMAMGIPLICNTGIGDTDEILKMFNSGYLIQDFSSEYFDRVLDEILLEKFDTHEIRKGARIIFSLDKGVEAYSNIYATLSV